MSDRKIYGTAGYRDDAGCLDEVVKRTAYFSGLRARKLNKTMGLMITASHNPYTDNGVKVIDIEGNMLSPECEQELDEIVNGSQELEQIVDDMTNAWEMINARVCIGTDTRQSAVPLLTKALEGLSLANLPSVVFHRHTTPQLHFIVKMMNTTGSDEEVRYDPMEYVTKFRNAYINFMKELDIVRIDESTDFQTLPNAFATLPLVVDCANGVGALWVQKYFPRDHDVRLFADEVRNYSRLNYMCGADYTKLTRNLPLGLEQRKDERYASLDGDADRLIYYEVRPDEVILLDGDHIMALFALFIHEQLAEIYEENIYAIPEFTFGVVQTAYSNGNSTRYFTELMGKKPVFTKTGVKNLEREARKFDIGIYFEANGHGTVCFSSKFKHYMLIQLKEIIQNPGNEVPMAVKLLHYFAQIVNDVVGDGIADLLAVEALLHYYGWTTADWLENTYTDLPSHQLKVPVQNRSIFHTADDDETRLISPKGLQERIDKIAASVPDVRAFVRPSGTESIVRIYVETPGTENDTMDLAHEIAKLLVPYAT